MLGRRRPHDGLQARAGDDAQIALERLVEGGVAGIEEKPAVRQAGELARACQDDQAGTPARRIRAGLIGWLPRPKMNPWPPVTPTMMPTLRP